MNAPPPASASSAAIHGHDRPPPDVVAAAVASGSNDDVGAVPVCTLDDAGVTESVLREAGGAALAVGGGARSRFDGREAEARRVVVASELGVTVVGAAVRGSAEGRGCGAVVVGRSDRRVTVPSSEKSRNCAGPTVSADGGGAAVTSTGASLFWAAAGPATNNARVAAKPPNALTVMRRTAVTSPTSMVSEKGSRPSAPGRHDNRPLLACKSREDKHLPADRASTGSNSGPTQFCQPIAISVSA
jgi:hypothetical protein